MTREVAVYKPVVLIQLDDELKVLADEKSWDVGLKLKSLTDRIDSFTFDSPVPCRVEFHLDKSEEYHGVCVSLTANGGDSVMVDGCLHFHQTRAEDFGLSIADKDLIAAVIISIGSRSRLDRGFIPFMKEANRKMNQSPWLQHPLGSGVHSGVDGIRDIEWGGGVQSIETDSSWTRYYVNVFGEWGYFMFPPENWAGCTLKTNEDIKAAAAEAARSVEEKTIEDMQKYIGWTVKAVTSEGVTIGSPCGTHSELITAGHSVCYWDSPESYLSIGESSITL